MNTSRCLSVIALLSAAVVANSQTLVAQTAAAHAAAGQASPGSAGAMLIPGDRIHLIVEGEEALTDTFTVSPAMTVTLPTVGEISVANVRRDRVTPHFSAALGKYFRDPVVHARTLIRVGIAGEVVRPGFYAVPADLVLTDALMIAGGTTPIAKVNDLRVERDGKRVLQGSRMRKAVGSGATFAQLGVRAGDVIQVPRATPNDVETTVRILAMFVTVPAVLFAISR
jgi:polysaccharide export outer membrane protein